MLFVSLNPSVKYSYQRELECAMDKGQVCLQRLEAIMENKKLSIEPIEYQHKHATDWFNVHQIYKECIQFSPEIRPNIDQAILIMDQLPAVPSTAIHFNVSKLHLFIVIWPTLLQRMGTVMNYPSLITMAPTFVHSFEFNNCCVMLCNFLLSFG